MAKIFDKVSDSFLNSIKSVLEKKLTPAEMKKREEVAKAIERENPDMPMGKKMAIATATAKKVAEATVDTADIEKRKMISQPDKDKLSKLHAMMAAEKKPVKEAKLDAVNSKELGGPHSARKDKDINNDGEVDKTDEYLHNRRRAIKQVMAKKMKEAKEYQTPTAAEIKKDKDREAGKGDRLYGALRAKLKNEDVERVDEGEFLDRFSKGAEQARKNNDAVIKSLGLKKGKVVKKGNLTTTHYTKEEAEQIDELSKKTLGSYTKKAAGSAAGLAAGAAAQAAITGSSREYDKRALRNRLKGISKAADKLTKEDLDFVDSLAADLFKEIDIAEAKMDGVAAGALPGDQHLCATKIFKEGLGEGQPIFGEHADPDEDGNIEWYDVLFDEGIERVYVADEGVEIISEMHHGDHKKKMKEEAEQIDEISADLARKAADTAYGKAAAASKKTYPIQSNKEKKANIQGRKFDRYANKKEMTNEEVEQIDEISGKTLVSYSNKVANYGPMKDAKTREKHEKGLYTAYKKMKAKDVKVPARMEEVEQVDEVSLNTLSSYIDKASDARGHRGLSTKKVDNRYKGVALAQKKGDAQAAKMEPKKLKSKPTAYTQQMDDAHRKIYGEETDLPWKEDSKNPTRKTGIRKDEYGNVVKNVAKHLAKKAMKANEDVEQVDEISKATMGRYINKAKNQIDGASWRTGYHQGSNPKADATTSPLLAKKEKQLSKRHRGIETAVKKLTREEAEITEARGRPRKENKDFTIHPKTKEKLMHDNPEHMKRIANLQRTGALPKPKTEAGQNIITQLRKAAVSMTGGAKVNFTHGASTHVPADHARKALEKHAGMKPADKEDFQNKIGHSHAQLMKHI